MLNLSWAHSYDWEHWINQADSLTKAHGTVARDYLKIDIESIVQGDLAKGKKDHDKRASDEDRDWGREKERIVKDGQ